MNLVKTYIDKSIIHGLGMFALENIPKGTVIWKFSEPDWIISEQQFDQKVIKGEYSQVELDTIDKYASRYKGFLVFYSDEAKYCNHSNDANTYTQEGILGVQIAKQDIIKGEEITCNYNEFDNTGGY